MQSENILSPYQSFIHISRYSRWLPELKRRETWPETVQRYVDFFVQERGDRDPELVEVMTKEIGSAIEQMKVMPSMRVLMTAGEALRRENVAAFNCAYLAVNNKRAFSEALYTLMCGTGVGFSCERQEISHLPSVPDQLSKVEDLIVVEDSKMGWAKAFGKLISSLYQGDIPKVDYSKIRPAGARLRTFGGRASGPSCLNHLFEFSVAQFQKAKGRKLSSLEVHDLMCVVGEIVVIGGVRRAALISLSNLSDQRMRDAKSGNWWVDQPQRALANNSVAYTEKPEASVFMEEWLSLVKSKSGERGIFNRVAAQKQASKYGRRSSTDTYGCNPCCFTGDMNLLTSEGYKPFSELAGSAVKVVNKDGSITEGSVWSSGVKPTVLVKFAPMVGQRAIRCTPDHLFMLNDGTECEAQHLEGKLVMSYEGTPRKVASVIEQPVAEVFDFTEPETHWGVVEGLVVHNSEIILRDKQFCNLSEIIIRAEDTKDSIRAKARIATIIGTVQATLTDFKFLGETWKKNTEEEALLGVSMTGIMDNKFMAGLENREELAQFLNDLREYCSEVNKEWAEKLGINPSAAITCVKPSGCTSLSTMIKTVDGSNMSMAEMFSRAGYDEDMLKGYSPGTWLPIPPEVALPHVLDENNEPQEITNLYVNGMKEVFAITFEDGNTYLFTGNHKLKTTTGWKRVDALTEEDDIVNF